MKQMLHEDKNIGIITTRLTKDDWSILATEYIIGHKAVSRYDIGYLFPLYRYNDTGNKKPNQNQNNHLFVEELQAQYNERRENFDPKFRVFIDLKYAHHYEPEAILGYIYAVLHSPAYRQKYAEFLKIDFPRIPFVDDRQTFEKLAALGWRLVQAHLLKDIPLFAIFSSPTAPGAAAAALSPTMKGRPCAWRAIGICWRNYTPVWE
jgi:predicted helicase